MPAGDIFGLGDAYYVKTNPVPTVSSVEINSTASTAGIAITGGILNTTVGIATLTFDTAAGLSTTPFYTGAKIAVSGLSVSGIAHTGYNGVFVVAGFAGTTTVSYATTGYVGPVNASISAQTGLVMLVTDTAVTNTTWSITQTHGWFGGGGIPGPSQFSTVDRTDFSNDTATANIRSSLSAAKSDIAATGNSNYGWFGGGIIATPAAVSTVERIDFSNDSATASVRGSLITTRYDLAATGNSNYGWFGGGVITFPTRVSTVDRIDFSNDSGTLLVRGSLSSARYILAATGNSNYGWFGGGTLFNGPLTSTVDRIDFSNDFSTASVRGPLTSIRRRLAAIGNSNYGWFSGGSPSSIVDRIDFSNDSTIVSPRGPLSFARDALAATGNSNYGWFGGGSSFPAYLSTVDRINFSNDLSTASVRGPLSAARGYSAATSGQARFSSTRLQKGGNYGWFAGGFMGDRIYFSNDSATASPRSSFGGLGGARDYVAATGNSNYGWFGGGYAFSVPSVTGMYSIVNRIDFSNDSATASLRRPLSLTRYIISATGNSNYGWFGGGFAITPTPTTFTYSTVDRIDFSNDNTTASPRGPLSAGRHSSAATGNSNYGWFGGGSVPSLSPTTTATVDRIGFSNDNASASPRSSLSLARYYLAATGNSNYGWFGGGYSGAAARATVDRIDFSNDSTSVSVRGPLSLARYALAATGNSNYGWFGGGAPGPKSTVDRINFSNDLSTASVRGSLSYPGGRINHAATSNSTR